MKVKRVMLSAYKQNTHLKKNYYYTETKQVSKQTYLITRKVAVTQTNYVVFV